MTPFYEDHLVTLYHGDALSITKLPWDRWPVGWLNFAAHLTEQLWCFGSFRMFWDRRDEFAPWTLAQDVVWEKHNGSNPAADRFRRVHELAVHFYRGDWGAIYKAMQYTPDGTARQVRRKQRPPQWGELGGHTYTMTDGGPRQMTSVMSVRGCHGYAVNETQKPEGAVAPLVAFSVPPDGVVLDPFAGSGTTLVVARRMGMRAIGIELRLEQCNAIVARLAQRDLGVG